MGLINYNNIDFNKSIDKENIVIDFNGSEIQILKYLPANDKYNLIMLAIQKAFDDNIYNDFRLKVHFELLLVFMYTNIEFPPENAADDITLYDTMKRSGLIDAVVAAIPQSELALLIEMVNKVLERKVNNKGNLFNNIMDFISGLPNQVQDSLEKLKEIDPNLLSPQMKDDFTAFLGKITSANYSR